MVLVLTQATQSLAFSAVLTLDFRDSTGMTTLKSNKTKNTFLFEARGEEAGLMCVYMCVCLCNNEKHVLVLPKSLGTRYSLYHLPQTRTLALASR